MKNKYVVFWGTEFYHNFSSNMFEYREEEDIYWEKFNTLEEAQAFYDKESPSLYSHFDDSRYNFYNGYVRLEKWEVDDNDDFLDGEILSKKYDDISKIFEDCGEYFTLKEEEEEE